MTLRTAAVLAPRVHLAADVAEAVRNADVVRFVDCTPVVERKEIPGFVGNRLQNALSCEVSAP
ncbi:hypothetical protein ACFQ68_03090 [Amycolatopsis japonica]|uniref:hypothetical protein n=1 Tax=Amycolatopsis japonica TaxID=208439 RepID=UPI003671FA32